MKKERGYDYKQKTRIAYYVLFSIYILCLLYITLFARDSSLCRKFIDNPFRSYSEWLSGNETSGRAILRNIALFIPCGYLLTELLVICESKISRWKKVVFVLIAGVVLSLVIETTQYFSGRGTADLTDVFNNTIGSLIGAALLIAVERVAKKLSQEDGRESKKTLQMAGGVLLIAVTLIGCVQMYGMVGTAAPNVNQFDFRIDSVEITNGLSFSGQCSTYYFPTPEYAIYLKGERTVTAETNINGNTFTAVANVPVQGTYEVLIRFKRFSRVSTATYIKDGNVLYVPAEVESLPDDPRLEGAILKAYSSAFDTCVYEKDGKLLWLIGYDIEDTTEIILHIDTNEPEKLPDNRKKYGFDNLGFHANNNEVEPIGHYRVFVKELPEGYNITGVTVGFNSNSRVTWSHRFRVEDND